MVVDYFNRTLYGFVFNLVDLNTDWNSQRMQEARFKGLHKRHITDLKPKTTLNKK
jgi:hypothetical protein